MLKKFSCATIASISLIFFSIASFAERTQKAGVGLESMVNTGYGLYAVTMRADASPGAISSFYLYEQSGSYPSRWHEIDIEMTPGFTSDGQVIDANHPHFQLTGQCFNPNSTTGLPQADQCKAKIFSGTAGSRISFNTYNHRAIDGEPYLHSNAQVFMNSNAGSDIFNNFHTYFFYYTPQGIYWTKDYPEVQLTMNPPSNLPMPVFEKKDFNVVSQNPTWKNNLAFQYDHLPLTPVLSNKQLAQTGALMRLSLNLWDGSNTDPSHQRDWGGPTSPKPGSSSAYKVVAYYPLKTPVDAAGNDPTKLQYGQATLYSDFTSKAGQFIVNGQTTTFSNLWRVSNGSYIWPLGQLDERNINCDDGKLTLSISDPYSQPRANYEPAKGCDWLNEN